jgi:hypothetical protein
MDCLVDNPTYWFNIIPVPGICQVHFKKSDKNKVTGTFLTNGAVYAKKVPVTFFSAKSTCHFFENVLDK